MSKHFVFFAAGSGSYACFFNGKKYIVAMMNSAVVTLVYGNKGFQSIIFREELEALKNHLHEPFACHSCFIS
jgi:ring-1,2-phenylacetyl-CoA epoxidase subunit PaaE